MNYRKMAKLAMSHGRYATSQGYAETALGRLGHPMPQSLLSLIAATMWQIVRQLSHRVGFGLVLGILLLIVCVIHGRPRPLGIRYFAKVHKRPHAMLLSHARLRTIQIAYALTRVYLQMSFLRIEPSEPATHMLLRRDCCTRSAAA